MWGVEDGAETMAMNPWNGVAQSQVWPGMGRGNGGQPAFSGVRVGDTRGARSWVEHQPVQAPTAQWNAQPSQWAVPPNQQSVPQGPGGWPMQQPWGGAANAPSGTYAEQAKKNMTPMGGRGQATSGRYDQSQPWGGLKVDQQTPWDTGTAASGPALHGGDPKVEWGSAAAAVAASGSRWGVAGASAVQWPTAPHASGTADWAHHNRHDPTGTAHWNSAQPHPAAMVQASVPGASWGPQSTLPAPSDQYDPNPQTPGPWVAPQPAEMNNDMMWHDPNPKQKKVQRDTGTSVWGDPNTQQGEIKRWKDAEMDDYSHVACAAPSGGDWSNIPVSTCHVSNNASPPATATGWGDPQTTPAHPLNDGTERWGAPPQSSGWGEPSKPENSNDSSQSPSEVQPANAPATNPAVNPLIENMRPGECTTVYSSLTQQIADQLRVAVSKGLIDVSLLNRPLPQSTLVLLNTILQKLPKLEQAQQEYSQVTRTMSSPAQKIEADRLLMEMQTLQNEIMQHRNTINEQFMKNRPQALNGAISTTPADGQSRLNQWKQANSTEGNPSEKVASSSSDSSVPALIASAQNMTLDDKIDWKAGSLDWSPPGSTAGERGNVEGNAVTEREEATSATEKVPTSTSQSAHGTPTPPVDDGPQEFVPGKKWEWRDPNKVAEDPNATPGNCKPNPLLSSSSSASFQATFGANVAQNYLNDLSVNKGAYMGWNAIPYGNEMWNGRSRPPSTVGQPFPQRIPAGQMPQTNYVRSMSSPGQQQFQFGAHWIFIQLHGINEKQVQMLCQKVGQILHIFSPPGSSFVCVKFAEPVEAVVSRLKAEVHYLQLKVMTEAEMERVMKFRGGGAPVMPVGAAAGWGAAPAPAADPNGSWAFAGGAVVTGDVMQQQQQHVFHSDDLSRPF